MVRCAIMIWIGAHFRPLGQIGRKNQEMKREAQTIFKMIWIFGLFALPVAAQSTPSDHDVLAAQERVQISGTLIAGAWMPRLGGNASLETSSGGSGTEIDFITQLNYRDLEPTFQGIFHLHVNDWTFGIEGFSFFRPLDQVPPAEPSNMVMSHLRAATSSLHRCDGLLLL